MKNKAKAGIRWKAVAILTMIVTLLLAAVAALGFWGATLRVTGVSAAVQPAGERADEYGQLRTLVSEGAVQGAVFTEELPRDENGYRFVCYRVRLKNSGLLPAEMAELRLSPADGDALEYTSGGEVTLYPGDEKEIWCMLLTRAEDSDARSITVSYYVWGHLMEVKAVYEAY